MQESINLLPRPRCREGAGDKPLEGGGEESFSELQIEVEDFLIFSKTDCLISPLKGANGFTPVVIPLQGECERCTFGVGAVPKSSARDVLVRF